MTKQERTVCGQPVETMAEWEARMGPMPTANVKARNNVTVTGKSDGHRMVWTVNGEPVGVPKAK